MRLENATPAPTASTAAAPKELPFSFDGGVWSNPTSMTLAGSAGWMSLAAATLAPNDDKTLAVPIAGPLTTGACKDDWHATAAEGHKASGSYECHFIP